MSALANFKPKETLELLSPVLINFLSNPPKLQGPQSSSTLASNSKVVLEFEGLYATIQAVCRQFKGQGSRVPAPEGVENYLRSWFKKLSKPEPNEFCSFNDPSLMSIRLQMMLSLIQCFTSPQKDFLDLFNLALRTLTLQYPADSSRQTTALYRTARGHGGAVLVDLAVSMGDCYKEIADQLAPQVEALLANDATSENERLCLYSVLVLTNIPRKPGDDFGPLNNIVQGVVSEFANEHVTVTVSSMDAFVDNLGWSEIARYIESRKLSGGHSLTDEGHTLLENSRRARRVTWVIKGVRNFIVATARLLKSDPTQLYEMNRFWTDVSLKILPNIVAFTNINQKLSNLDALKTIPEPSLSFLRAVSKESSGWIVGVSTKSKQDYEARSEAMWNTMEEIGHEIQQWIQSTRHNCLQLFEALFTLGEPIIGVPGLVSGVFGALFSNVDNI
jgi:hypothetical protein